jgi:hypothetical protein
LLTVSSSSARLRTSPSLPTALFIWRYQLHSFSWYLLSDRFVKIQQPPITVFPWCKDNADIDISRGFPVDSALASDPTRNQSLLSVFSVYALERVRQNSRRPPNPSRIIAVLGSDSPTGPASASTPDLYSSTSSKDAPKLSTAAVLQS